ncbi:LVIVD repeat-containing protein [Sinobacterium caligoides]|uniref:LVIVD repeat-containing protein n=1 Tax=Sinobacterium caligoides TaxID=933926 RepID=A0A3N2DPQ4_9GAMM|nr:hypothetical protein [Sinobacterium caligoides]ROS01682.1 LVIVD repeat-containing protein [Sinobacterium caligoides]
MSNRTPKMAALIALASSVLVACSASHDTVEEHAAAEGHSAPYNIADRFVQRQVDMAEDKTPVDPLPSSYGMNKDGSFTHPVATRDSHDQVPFDGILDYWDSEQYIKNMKVEAFYPIVVEPFHTWQNIVDFDGRRYLYQYVRRDLKIYDITKPKELKLLLTKGNTWGIDGPGEEVNPYPEDDMFGAASIQWNEKLGKNIMVQSFEIRRFGLLKDKYHKPEQVEAIRKAKHLKGFKVYAMNGPMPEDWELLAERTTDYKHPDAPIGEQQGSGVRDIPVYFGGDTMFVAAAPEASHSLTEYPNDLYSAGYQSWDMSDPANPKFLQQLNVAGQIAGDAEHEAAYKANPRAGNRTSWMGARMSLFIPTPVEKGGKYGYAAMGGLGFYVVDITNPAEMKIVSHMAFEPNVAGVEGDFIDVSQVEKTGIVYFSGYPLNEDCWEPYKNVHMIDVRQPEKPVEIGILPRPKPPADAAFTDFCQRRGSFGPKRTGYYTQPGTPKEGILPFNFYNAGLQVFDVSDLENPEIVAYFVPPFDTENVAEYARGNLSHSVYIEYDRNLFWEFTNHGIYLLSSPVLGEPNFGAPKTPWPAR